MALPLTMLIHILLIVLKSSGIQGQSDETTIRTTAFSSVNITRNVDVTPESERQPPMLAIIHDIYDSVVGLTKDFSRFPMDDAYVPDTVSIQLSRVIRKRTIWFPNRSYKNV